MINRDLPSSARLYLDATELKAYADELNARRPNSAQVVIEPPYDIPSIKIADSFGNVLVFHQPISAEEQAARDARKHHMREYIRQQLADGRLCPTPEEVAAAVGGPVGMAMDILCEFPEYAQATRRGD